MPICEIGSSDATCLVGLCEHSERWSWTQGLMPLLLWQWYLFGALGGRQNPWIPPLCYLPRFLSFNLYFNSKRISLIFFKLAATRDLPIFIHLYLCLRLTALIWFLPHFQVHVIMFSAPDCVCMFFSFFPKAPVKSAWGEAMRQLLLFLERQQKDMGVSPAHPLPAAPAPLSSWDSCPERKVSFTVNV